MFGIDADRKASVSVGDHSPGRYNRRNGRDSQRSIQAAQAAGRGGTGEVFEAHDLQLNRHVAIKRVVVDRRTRDDMLERLRIEAENLAGVEHPNVVVVHDVLETASSVAIIMELVRGVPLLKLFRKRPIPPDQYLSMFRQLVDGMEAIHDEGIVHRDLNPRNVLVTKQGGVKIIDFGLSTLHGDENPRAGGTLGYMAPECLRRNGLRVTYALDIYSLGFLSYQALLGLAPFKKLYGTTRPRDWVRWVLSREPFKPLSEIDSRIPTGFAEIIGRMLAKDAAERFQRTLEVRTGVEKFLETPGGRMLIDHVARTDLKDVDSSTPPVS